MNQVMFFYRPVKLNTIFFSKQIENVAFRRALFRMHGIKECNVKLHRLKVVKDAQKKFLTQYLTRDNENTSKRKQ